MKRFCGIALAIMIVMFSSFAWGNTVTVTLNATGGGWCWGGVYNVFTLFNLSCSNTDPSMFNSIVTQAPSAGNPQYSREGWYAFDLPAFGNVANFKATLSLPGNANIIDPTQSYVALLGNSISWTGLQGSALGFVSLGSVQSGGFTDISLAQGVNALIAAQGTQIIIGGEDSDAAGGYVFGTAPGGPPATLTLSYIPISPPPPVPEPASLTLVGIGLGSLACKRFKRAGK